MAQHHLGREVRLRCRANGFIHPFTADRADGHIHANLVILPSKYASDFRALCHRNPVPCPLLGESPIGDPTRFAPSPGTGFNHALFSHEIDVRTDLPKYNIYRSGELLSSVDEIRDYWTEDSVAFLLGSCYSVETALAHKGWKPRHWVTSTDIPMYRTTIPLNPAGVFVKGTYVVSMRPYPTKYIMTIRELTAPCQIFSHGEPIAWGWEGMKLLGIKDIEKPEWGEALSIEKGEIPVFWGCGVTWQNCLLEMGDQIQGDVITHYPEGMLVCDLLEEDVIKSQGKG
jgi:uncharacterized protein YcsI (UPF0317 family)